MRALALLAGLALLPAAAGAQAAGVSVAPHGALALPCAQCHRPDGWRPTAIAKDFKHAPTRFPLEGAHARVSCTTCHTRLDFTGVSTNCASCHRDVHQGELGTNCATCHTTRSFIDLAAMRQRHQLTRFPLTGGHAAADCRSCHTPRAPGQQVFVGRSTSCVSCHLTDYQRAGNPSHAASGFSRDCATCHSTAGWTGAAFLHSATRFPLVGAHRAVNCTACHGDGVYRGKSTACVSCHLANYTATTNPSHAAAGFPTDCASCHTPTTWLGATFDHDAKYFPIYSGAHAQTWSTCARCHTNSASYAVFDCLGCHLKTKTDEQHRGRAGYVYASPNCYACHPRGKS